MYSKLNCQKPALLSLPSSQEKIHLLPFVTFLFLLFIFRASISSFVLFDTVPSQTSVLVLEIIPSLTIFSISSTLFITALIQAFISTCCNYDQRGILLKGSLNEEKFILSFNLSHLPLPD